MLCAIKTSPGSDIKYLNLPRSDNELSSKLMDMGVSRESGFQCIISDVVTGNEKLDMWLKRCKLDVDELNLFERFMQSNPNLKADLPYIFDFENPETAAELINITYGAKDYLIYSSKNDVELGREITNNRYDNYNMSEEQKNKTYAEYGRKYQNGKAGAFTEGGYVVRTLETRQRYNGAYTDDFPIEKDTLFLVTVASVSEYTENNLRPGHSIKSITLSLPTTDYHIARMLNRLGINDERNCVVVNVEGNECAEATEMFSPENSPYDINRFAEILSSINNKSNWINKLCAVMEYEQVRNPSVKDIIHYGLNLDKYEFNNQVHSKGDMVYLRLKEGTDIGFDVDIDKLYERIISDNEGRFTSYGLVMKTGDKHLIHDHISSANTYEFREHNFTVRGEKKDLLDFADAVRGSETEGTLADLAYQIEYAFDVDNIRSMNEEDECSQDENYAETNFGINGIGGM